jgi:hypothetical protein
MLARTRHFSRPGSRKAWFYRVFWPGTHSAHTLVSANQTLFQPTIDARRTDMKTLIINDLAATCELSRGAMTAIRGGHGSTSMPWTTMYSPTYDTSIKANQNLMQFQDVKNLTANGSAFISGVSATNNTDQFGQNNLAVL